jgi:hypothetical protein
LELLEGLIMAKRPTHEKLGRILGTSYNPFVKQKFKNFN